MPSNFDNSMLYDIFIHNVDDINVVFEFMVSKIYTTFVYIYSHFSQDIYSTIYNLKHAFDRAAKQSHGISRVLVTRRVLLNTKTSLNLSGQANPRKRKLHKRQYHSFIP